MFKEMISGLTSIEWGDLKIETDNEFLEGVLAFGGLALAALTVAKIATPKDDTQSD